MTDIKKGKAFKTSLWVNPIIICVFLTVEFTGRYMLGWEEDLTHFIVWFALFLINSILVNCYLFLIWDKPEKTY